LTDPEASPTKSPLPPIVRGGIALALVLVAGLLLLKAGGPADEVPLVDASPHGSVPQVAPTFSLPDREGTTHGLEQFVGRPVLLNFWATWCPPCLDEMPALQKMITALADTDLVVVAISLDENWDVVAPVLQQTGFGSGVLLLLDPDRAVAEQFGTFKVPETYLIDRQGTILHRYQGAKAWDSEPFLEDLRAFVEGDFDRQPAGHP
jgi:peroxiredoxin